MADPPDFRPTQEVRFAVVMYGGVSLAIYINGVAQELLALVRATAPASPDADTALHADAELAGSTAAVYRELGRLLRYGERLAPDAAAQPGDPIRTRFVVDVISGTSAGGINGVYLAKALAGNRSIDALKDLWVDEGDIAKLVDDERSYADLEGLAPARPPRAALNGRRMYWKLLEALDGMDPENVPAPADSPLVDELDLWVTTTDLRGITVPVDLYDRMVFELRHRKVFRFLYRGSLTAGPDGIENQFGVEHNPMLAFAARCTSAFPFAFEPVQLGDVDAVLRAPRFGLRYPARDADDDAVARWRALFADSPAPGDAGLRSFADGGYLDNKPFSWATGSLALRSAHRPVDRRLIYIEPDPGSPRVAPHPPGAEGEAGNWGPLSHLDRVAAAVRPDALQNVQAAMVGIPRYEPIREDLEQLIERNREVDRLREIIRVLDELEPAERPETLDIDTWRRRPVGATAPDRGLQYVAYQRLKVAATGDDVAALLTRRAGADEHSDEQSAIRCLVQAWLDRHFPQDGEEERSQNEFLVRYDFGYRVRRLDFLQRRADEAIRAGADDAALLAFKRALSRNLAALRGAGRALRAGAGDRLPLDRSLLLGILNGAVDKAESVRRAGERLVGVAGLEDAVTRTMEVVHAELAPAFTATREALVEALEAVPHGAVADDLRRVYDLYELYDSVHYPIAYRSVGESDRVEVIRVSPLDATSLVADPEAQRRKLAGNAIHHFGGFFDVSWRRNDILWGRLDAAERIITSFLPPGAARERLLRDAQHAIVGDEVLRQDRRELVDGVVKTLLDDGESPERAALARGALEAATTPEAVLEQLRVVPEQRRLDPAVGLETAARMATVTGKVLEALSAAPQARAAGRWTARLGRFGVAFVELAVGRSVTALLTRWWAQVLVVAALVMIVGGALVGLPGAATAGWVLLGVIALVKLARWALHDFLARGGPATRARRLGTAAAIAVAVLCVAWAALALGRAVSDGIDDAACDLPDPLERITQDAWPFGARDCGA